jgi:hypothetical protein
VAEIVATFAVNGTSKIKYLQLAFRIVVIFLKDATVLRKKSCAADVLHSPKVPTAE